MSIQEVYSKTPSRLFCSPIDERGGFALHFIDQGQIIGNPLKVSEIYERPDGVESVYYPAAGESPEATINMLHRAHNKNSLIKVETEDGPIALSQSEFRAMNGLPAAKHPMQNFMRPISSTNLRPLQQDTFQPSRTTEPGSQRNKDLDTFLSYDIEDGEGRDGMPQNPYNPPLPKDISVKSAPYKKGKTSPKGTWINKVI